MKIQVRLCFSVGKMGHLKCVPWKIKDDERRDYQRHVLYKWPASPYCSYRFPNSSHGSEADSTNNGFGLCAKFASENCFLRPKNDAVWAISVHVSPLLRPRSSPFG